MFDLTGRVALVTGSGQSVGAGIAATLAECGAAVAVNDRFEERAETSARAIRDAGGTAFSVVFDVTDRDAVTDGVARVTAELGPVDILVNNAGVVQDGPGGLHQFRDLDPEEWHRNIDLNLYGVLNTVKATIDGMCERGYGRVITISSGAATGGLDLGVSLYAAGKGGALSFTRHLALETAQYGVTANSLALGLMANAWETSQVLRARAGSGRASPVGRPGTGRDVGAAIVWLAAEGDWVTGQTISLNGGSGTH